MDKPICILPAKSKPMPLCGPGGGGGHRGDGGLRTIIGARQKLGITQDN